jgi:hypothetical protein
MRHLEGLIATSGIGFFLPGLFPLQGVPNPIV